MKATTLVGMKDSVVRYTRDLKWTWDVQWLIDYKCRIVNTERLL